MSEPNDEGHVDLMHAPWTDDEVVALTAYQELRLAHPYTCPNGGDAKHGHQTSLKPSKEGFACPRCQYKQTSAYGTSILLLDALITNTQTPDIIRPKVDARTRAAIGRAAHRIRANLARNTHQENSA